MIQFASLVHGLPLRQKGVSMSRKTNQPDDGEMRSEYDFSAGVRGKFYKGYKAGSNVVLLEPDVAEVFRNSASVNEALRALARIAKRVVKPKSRKRKSA